MYDKGGVAAGGLAGAGALASTGAEIVWILLAGFALFAAGLALLRIVPRRQG